MRCRVCDYALWNLHTRHCPECGESFHPSEYEFVPNAVQFRCPHCEQAYFGTDVKGHLSPRAFTCSGCQTNVSMDEMVLLPAAGVQEWETQIERLPWTESRGTGRFSAWFVTVWRALFTPHRVLKSRPPSNATSSAWSFAIVTSLMVTLAVALPYLFLVLVLAGVATGFGGGALQMRDIAIIVGVGLLVLGGVVVMTVIYIALWGLFAHGVLKWTGPLEDTIGRTYQAICYSSGANVSTAVPCLGSYFGWIWWTVSAVFMIKDAQRVSGARATAAAVIFPVLSVVFALVA